jgi:hypothetical protein
VNVAVVSVANEYPNCEERFFWHRCPAGLQHAPLATMSQPATSFPIHNTPAPLISSLGVDTRLRNFGSQKPYYCVASSR